jgi:hypothetical protein
MPSAIFLSQIDTFFGKGVREEDPMVGFHRRLEARKLAGGVSSSP